MDIKPDLTTLGKIIGGGFPVGAVGGPNDMMALFTRPRGSRRFPRRNLCGNPVTMRAGLACMQNLDRATFKRLDLMGHQVRSGIGEAFRSLGVPGQVVGAGSLLKVHFTDRPLRDYRSAFQTKEEAQMMGAFHRSLLNRGILAARSGMMALSTPMTDDDLGEIIRAVKGAILDLKLELDTQKENVSRDLGHLREVYNAEIKVLGEKIENLRQDISQQHQALVGLLTKLVDSK